MRQSIILAVLCVAVGAMPVLASESGPMRPDKKEKCPVCGMFVHKYPDWMAQVVFIDGSQFYFDGVKDLFKFMLKLDTYHPGKTAGDIKSVRVTDYYDMLAIDGRSAHYVIGGDVYGPMGKELIPFATRAAAAEFSKDHGGTAVLTYEQITPAVIEKLD